MKALLRRYEQWLMKGSLLLAVKAHGDLWMLLIYKVEEWKIEIEREFDGAYGELKIEVGFDCVMYWIGFFLNERK